MEVECLDLLLEIGTEEMPAGMMAGAIEGLAAAGRALMEKERLACESVLATGTPRRLVLHARGVAARQDDLAETVRGPAAVAAFDAEGRPTGAAAGFARSQGVDVGQLRVQETPAGRYVFADRVVPGRPAPAVLAEKLPALVDSLEFPRSMRWGAGEYRFIRPIRWVLALLGGEVIPFEVAGVASGRVTYGHRVLGPGPIEVADAREYFERLERQGFVLADHRRRRDEVDRQVQTVAAGIGGRPVVDDDLLNEVNHLVEYPTAFAGSFAADYLALPPEVLVTTMKHHQRYFPVTSPDGGLLPAFIGVRNGDRSRLDLVVAGNEKVLRARLADARFFFIEDTKRSLADYVDDLKAVLFQARLGTLRAKVERVRRLAGIMVDRLSLPEGEAAALAAEVDRAAFLCKADLATSMVYEFPELQGVMGREYARLSGESEGVARAIFEHLLPRFAGDEPPATPAGSIVSVADKLDTVVGCFGAGIQPTGSHDPYALRRQALGVLHVLSRADTGLRWPLGELCAAALEGYHVSHSGAAGPARADQAGADNAPGAEPPLRLDEAGKERLLSDVREFFLGRMRGLLADEGLSPVLEAVLRADTDFPALVGRRARALARLSGSADFEEALVINKRAANLAGKARGDEVRDELLGEESERVLWKALEEREPVIRAAVLREDYGAYFTHLAGLRGPLDGFLDNVMVMVDDEAVRGNRLALLRRVAGLCALVADLGHLQTALQTA